MNNSPTDVRRIKNVLMSIFIIGITCSPSLFCQANKTGTNLNSRFYTDSIFSNHLNEYRKHNVYLSKGFNLTNTYPIIYATDGDEPMLNGFIKRTLDSLIDNKLIKPIIYIGSHSNSRNVSSINTVGGEGMKIEIQYRFFEYVENTGVGKLIPALANSFKNHILYFKDELIPMIEEAYNQQISRKDRIFYGVSNGAGFGANMLNKYPDVIGTYICFSTLGSNVEKNEWKANTDYPDLYLKYGDEESPEFRNEAEKLIVEYQKSGSFFELKIFEGGHDYNLWNKEFMKTVGEILRRD